MIVGLGLGLIGGGAMITLGPVFAKEALGGDSATFGALMTALGLRRGRGRGAAPGVPEPAAPRDGLRVRGHGHAACSSSSRRRSSSLGPAALAVGLRRGVSPGTSYVTGFTVLQETVSDELRGRTFATLYTVIRMCLLISLVISPLWADFWDWVTTVIIGGSRIVTLGGADYAFPGVRIALWGGGLITLCAGVVRPLVDAARAPPRAAEPARSDGTNADARRGSGLGDRMSTAWRGRRGRFVVLEGGDGSGKSTQVGALVARLHAAGRRRRRDVRAGRDPDRRGDPGRCCSTARPRSTRRPRRC